MLIKLLAIWLVAKMAFHLNSLTDPGNPGSKMNPFHEDRVEEESCLKEQMETGDAEGRGPILWNRVWPVLEPSLVTGACLILYGILNWFQSAICGEIGNIGCKSGGTTLVPRHSARNVSGRWKKDLKNK